MQVNSEIDILERDIADYSSLLLHIILLDHTTGRNIIWATEDYAQFGEEYGAKKSIEATQITGNYSKVIQPRITKAQTDQISRTRDKAEVFTPSWKSCSRPFTGRYCAWTGIRTLSAAASALTVSIPSEGIQSRST